MKKNLRCVAAWSLLVLLLTSNAYAGSVFPDVDDDADYAEATVYLSSMGLMVGDKNGYFNPTQSVTRAEMATIICRLLDETEQLSISDQFSDVPTSHWANKFISRASGLGIVSGYGGGRYGPEDTVTYVQALAMLLRASGLENVVNNEGGYPDGFISVATDYGYTNGISANNNDLLERWQVAIILYNATYGG